MRIMTKRGFSPGLVLFFDDPGEVKSMNNYEVQGKVSSKSRGPRWKGESAKQTSALLSPPSAWPRNMLS